MQSRTKTEDMPALQVAGAGHQLLAQMRQRHEHPEHSDFTDDEPTRPMGRVVTKER